MESTPTCVFDAEARAESFEPTFLTGFKQLHICKLSATSSRLARAQWQLDGNWNAMLANVTGSLLAQSNRSDESRIFTPGTFMYSRHGVLDLAFGRGLHECVGVLWKSESCPPLTDWVNEHLRADGEDVFAATFTAPNSPAYDRLQEALGNTAWAEPRIFGVMLDIVPQMLADGVRVNLTPVPQNLPETIVSLIEQVDANPATPWPLKDAADFAGYSPFHFSRLFKQLVGYGFHEYVDRSRTALATQMLLRSELSVDEIAAAAGFGTSQGLRESVKEHLGFLPSEIRPT